MSILFFIFFIQISSSIQDYTLIKDGKGFRNIELDETTFKDVKKVLGKPDTVYFKKEYTNVNLAGLGYSKKDEWGDLLTFSYTYEYPNLGIYLSGNHKEEPNIGKEEYIMTITFKAPFKGITEKGIKLNESKLVDVLEKYGTDLKNIGFPDYSIEYYKEGIIFHFEAKEIDHNSMNFGDYQDLKVVGITIVLP